MPASGGTECVMINEARWIKSPENEEERCYEFYTRIDFEKKIKKAELSVSAMGMYRAFIDDERIGNDVFTPYFTDYSSRTQYMTYDVADMLKSGAVLSVICAEGWAVGKTWGRYHYNKNIAVIFSVDIEFEDGSVLTAVSGSDTLVRTSKIVSSSIYDGETVDNTAKLRELGNALHDDAVKTNLVPQYGENVIEQDVVMPSKLIITPLGERVIDFGQNLSGYAEIRINGNFGEKVAISHAEVLDKDGNFYTKNLRSAKQKNVYILSGNGTEILKPTFTWQGFRYIRLDEYPKSEINLNDFRAVAVYSDIKRTGGFVCGNPKINQLYHNVIWGQKSNYIDIPTDCPQRDERMGWTGDAQVFVRTAAINFDVERFFEKWLADLASDQRYDGGVQRIVPALNPDLADTAKDVISAAWGDAATICPWEIYRAYGNKRVLKNQFESMKKWIEYIRKSGSEEYLWLGGIHFGDWLALDNKPGSYVGATPTDYIASAFYAYSTSLAVKAGKVLGYDMSEYEELYKNVVAAFRERFLKDGTPEVKTQTAYALALYFDLCTDKKKNAEKLCELVQKNGNKLTTGFVGTPYLLYALSENGYIGTAFDLLFREEFPSWLYSVNNGATTMWEHWDGINENGEMWSENMNSFNHYAYGAVYSWIFEIAGGIRINEDEDGYGYKNIIICPHTDKRFGFLKTSIKTKFGRISSSWRYGTDNEIHFEFEIPDGVSARVILNGGKMKLGGGKYLFTKNY